MVMTYCVCLSVGPGLKDLSKRQITGKLQGCLSSQFIWSTRASKPAFCRVDYPQFIAILM